MLAAVIFLALVAAPLYFVHSFWVFFWVMLIGLPVTFAAIRPEKPTEFNAEVWDKDPKKRAHNLKLARKAWRKGETWVNPEKAEREKAEAELMKANPGLLGSVVIHRPNNEHVPRLVRCCPMHKPRWE